MGPSMDTKALPEYFWLGYNAQRTGEQGTDDLYWRGKVSAAARRSTASSRSRPPPDDFDEWSTLGITGWSFADVLPYFNRLEDDVMYGDEWYHGHSGPIPIHRFPQEQWSDLDVASVVVGAKLGFGFDQPDMNACPLGTASLTSRTTVATTGGSAATTPTSNRRGSPEPRHPRRPHRRPRAVRRHACRSSRAPGPDGPVELFADEIVLCGGTAGSAGIALRSGLGPATDLRRLDIEVISDLPVGAGVQDHTSIGFIFPMGQGGAPGVKRPVVATRYSSGEADAGRNDMLWNVSGPWRHPRPRRPHRHASRTALPNILAWQAVADLAGSAHRTIDDDQPHGRSERPSPWARSGAPHRRIPRSARDREALRWVHR